MVGYRIFLVITIPATYIFYVSLMELFSDSSTSIGRTADWREYTRFFFLARDTLETSAEARVEKSHGGTPIAPINKIFLLVYILEGRKLLQASGLLEPQGNESYNCTPPAINEFPPDGLTRQQRQAGFIIIHFVIAIYLFLLLAIVCDDFFVPSIKKICDSEYRR